MAHFQAENQMPISFLQIAWTGSNEWVIHEIVPGAQQWDIVPVKQMLDNQPLLWTGPRRGQRFL